MPAGPEGKPPRRKPTVGGGIGGKEASQPDDAALWREVAAGVTPLKRRRPPVETPPPPALPKKPKKAAAAPPPPPPPPLPPALPPAPAAAPFDRRTVRRLKRGGLAIEARLDLHGDTQSAAHRRLERFIAESQAAGLRLVLVITGKGQGGKQAAERPGEQGVLRQAVPRWLEEAPNRRRVLNVTAAAPVHGGEGALYVRLRRKA